MGLWGRKKHWVYSVFIQCNGSVKHDQRTPQHGYAHGGGECKITKGSAIATSGKAAHGNEDAKINHL